MSKYHIVLDQERCISCHACEVHCQMKNRVPPDARLGKLVALGPVLQKGKPRMLNMFMPCFHCERPWCVAACPTGAMIRREDGIVYLQDDLCVGCKACIRACPWQIPQWNDSTGRAMKCDFCRDPHRRRRKTSLRRGLHLPRPLFRGGQRGLRAHTREDYAKSRLLRR